MTKTKQKWQDEFVELYGYLDKYSEGIVHRLGLFIAHTRKQAQEEILDKVKIGKACGVDEDRTTKCWCRLKAIENYETKIKKLKGL